MDPISLLQSRKGEMPAFRKDREYRQFFSNLVLRTAADIGVEDDKAQYVEGVACVFEQETVLYSFDGVDYKEIFSRDAFNGVDITSDVVFNYNHGGKVLSRTRNKTLSLWIEADGLHCRMRLDGTAQGREMYEEIKGGYIDRMSLCFTVAESSYDFDTHTRTILRVKKLYDVSAVDFPAYDTTSVSARSLVEEALETEHKAAAAAELRKKILEDEIKLTIEIYGGTT